MSDAAYREVWDGITRDIIAGAGSWIEMDDANRRLWRHKTIRESGGRTPTAIGFILDPRSGQWKSSSPDYVEGRTIKGSGTTAEEALRDHAAKMRAALGLAPVVAYTGEEIARAWDPVAAGDSPRMAEIRLRTGRDPKFKDPPPKFIPHLPECGIADDRRPGGFRCHTSCPHWTEPPGLTEKLARMSESEDAAIARAEGHEPHPTGSLASRGIHGRAFDSSSVVQGLRAIRERGHRGAVPIWRLGKEIGMAVSPLHDLLASMNRAQEPVIDLQIAADPSAIPEAVRKTGRKTEGGLVFYVSLRDLPHHSQTLPAREFIAAKIDQLRREGYPQKQAVAVAMEEARKAGYRSVPKRKK